ncbi:MAG: YybH family protein [Sphingobacteriales bacterium]
MNTQIKKGRRHIVQAAALLICFFVTVKAKAQVASDSDPATKEIISVMQKSADEWNKGNLEAFMSLYDPSATMMMPTGPAGMDVIKTLYEKKYFDGKMPKQNLRYSDMAVRHLGRKYVLLTGAFTLYGNSLPERSGRYSLVLIHTKNGWKILHDHSG